MSLHKRKLHQKQPARPLNCEPLESRLLLSTATPQIPHGYSPLRWHGRDTIVRTAQWIIKIDAAKGSPSDQLKSLQQSVHRTSRNLNVRQYLGGEGMVLITSGTRAKYSKLLSALKSIRGFKYLEPNFLLQATTALPNDPLFPSMDDLDNTGQSGGTPDADIDAPEAWQFTTGSSDLVVGVIDSGIDYNHPDLAPNMWTNPFEIPGDGIDNDGNGYIDDVHGWDFLEGNNSIYDGTGDDHGTHVTGTIAATGGNGAGVAGVNWNATYISGKFLGANGGSTAGAIKAIDYFSDLKQRHGLDIVALNNSWGGGGYSQGLHDAIIRAAKAGILFVAAAGNSGANNDTTAN